MLVLDMRSVPNGGASSSFSSSSSSTPTPTIASSSHFSDSCPYDDGTPDTASASSSSSSAAAMASAATGAGDSAATTSQPLHMLSAQQQQQQQYEEPPIQNRLKADKPPPVPVRTSSIHQGSGGGGPPSPPATLASSSRHTSLQLPQSPSPLSPKFSRHHGSSASTSSAGAGGGHGHHRRVSRNNLSISEGPGMPGGPGSSNRHSTLGLHPLRLPRGGPSPHDQEMARLRQTQLLAREARRQQLAFDQAEWTPAERAAHEDAQDNAQGAFEVMQCFLERLARAENELLASPKSKLGVSAEHDRAREELEVRRQETQEALQPLLAYGRTTKPKKPLPAKPAAAATRPGALLSTRGGGPSAPPKARLSTTTSIPMTTLSATSPLPPTPPQSPRRVHRKDDSHDLHHHHLSPLHVDSQGNLQPAASRTAAAATTTTASTTSTAVKRASMVFSWALPSSSR